MSDQHEPRPHRPDDRMGLEAFDAVDAPDQWDDITRRADGAELASSQTGSRRRSPATWFMAAAAVALVAVAAVAVSVRSGDDSAPTPATTPDGTLPTPDTEPTATPPVTTMPATTVAPGTTVPPETTPVTTSVPVTTVPTTVEPVAPVTAWEPDCIDRFGDAEPPPAIDDGLTQFTTLGTEPSLDIAIPTIDTANGVEPPLVSPVVVPGGVALTSYGYTADSTDAAAVVVVDDDGSVRWRRCFEGEGSPSGPLYVGAGAVTLVTTTYGVDTGSVTIRRLDPATGRDAGDADVRPDTVVGHALGDLVLLQRPWQADAVDVDAQLEVLDLVTGAITSIPYPDAAIAGDPVYFELVDVGDDVMIAGTTFTRNAPDIVWTGDSWSTEPDDLRALPPSIRIPFGNDVPLQLLDGAGAVLWEVDGFHTISREGFNNAIADSVVVVMECLDWTDDLGCQWIDESTPPREQLSAFDLATGERLWARPGGQSFAAIAGDRGIVTAEVGWELVDLRTGERVDDQPVTAWPQDDIFFNECCGAGDYVWTRLDGGVLFESTGDRLRVWLPPEASTPTVTADAFS